MYSKKLLSYTMLFVMAFSFMAPVAVGHAAGLEDIVNTLAASSAPASDNGGLLSPLLSLLFDKILGPILNIFHGGTASNSGGTSSGGSQSQTLHAATTNGAPLSGKVIVVDPGHGGSNPGAVANDTRESDNNLAVGLKLRDKLVQAGAKVIMTRDTDRTVAPEGSSLGQELQARVDLAENNHADIFVSVHTNENDNTAITGAETFYASGKKPALAQSVETSLIARTQAVSKGIAPETFYVLRNTTMPGILVEMGFISNSGEAARLASDSYRNTIAQGICDGIVNYFYNA